jgi:hypothetical protein
MDFLRFGSAEAMLLCRSACPKQRLPYLFPTMPNFVLERFNPLFASQGCPGVNSSVDRSSKAAANPQKKRRRLSAGQTGAERGSCGIPDPFSPPRLKEL